MRYFILFLFLFSFASVHAQKQEMTFTDSLAQVVLHAKEDTNKAKLLDALSFAYYTIDPAKGLQYARQLINLSEKLGWQTGLAMGYADLGINYEAVPDHAQAMESDLMALKLCEQQGNKKGMFGNLANISVIYVDQSNYPKALEYALQALWMSEELNDVEDRASILSNIAVIYLERKNYTKALQYDSAALVFCNELHDKEGLNRVLGSMAIVQDARGNYDEALQTDMKLLAINRADKNENAVHLNLANIGYVYCHKKDYTQALYYQEAALNASRALGSKSSVAIDLGNIGETYYSIATDTEQVHVATAPISKTAAIQQSINYLEQGIALCEQTNTAGPMMEFTKYLSDANLIAGKPKEAFAAYKQYTTIKDSLFSLQNSSTIAKLETNRELELRKKQIQIDQLEVDKTWQDRELYTAGIIVLLLIIGIVMKSLHNYRKSNRALQKENSKHLEVIEGQVRHIKNQAYVLDEIANIQSHDVRGPVATILGLVKVFNFEDTADPSNKLVIEGIATVVEQLDIAVQEVIKKENSVDRPSSEANS